jgi:hypothetical protein
VGGDYNTEASKASWLALWVRVGKELIHESKYGGKGGWDIGIEMTCLLSRLFDKVLRWRKDYMNIF